MYQTIDYLKSGTKVQQLVYHAIHKLKIMEDLADYHPVLCGTIPLNINTPGSDLDIIMEVNDLSMFEKRLLQLYRNCNQFALKTTIIRERQVVKATFMYDEFEFELFGQAQPVLEQHAFLHMVIEGKLLENNELLRGQILQLKREGIKTEPAFCQILGLKGDPYLKLIEYGRMNKLI